MGFNSAFKGLNQERKWAKMYVRLGGRSPFERNICRVKRPLLGKLLTSLAVSYSSFVYKKQ